MNVHQLAEDLRHTAKAPSTYPSWVIRDLMSDAAEMLEHLDSLGVTDVEMSDES